ncbi:pro-corazonin [Belonocnema kinseyi]|uniref:pro-corazonin n=1 Tax=Belonocnema kinseyi TaxID=2817044 RepID=UPI00143CFE7B|nr:pro-corazonin [Belonocnema kinseyi]XP_033208707.1 pro-corazonin [Belonocnema kinseyi]
MERWTSIMFVFSLAVILGNCQTFQYSRGWTNGKRAENLANNFLEVSKLAGARLQGTGSQLANLQANCRLQKLKMLLQGNGNEQAHFATCEFMNALRRSSPVAPMASYFRHSSSSENSIRNNN